MTDSRARPEGAERTPLHELHLELGARMVEFSGYELPVQYPEGIKAEHAHTRAAASLFDVSHMGQGRLTGRGVPDVLESLAPIDAIGLGAGRQRYTFFTNDEGGVLDDLMVTNTGDGFFVVCNAACKAEDLEHLRDHLAAGCAIEELGDRALLALQGPLAATVLGALAPGIERMPFMSGRSVDLLGHHCFVNRCGYTGEDGFEISVPARHAPALARHLLRDATVRPAGLGARDSLRLEAGLCLYGHDLGPDTTPVEAGLDWAIFRARRSAGARAGGFPGSEVILEQMARGPRRRRVGLRPVGRAPVREGAVIVDGDEEVGTVTSGGYGPSVEAPVAMGYVCASRATLGSRLQAMVRGRALEVDVVEMPFVAHRYHRG